MQATVLDRVTPAMRIYGEESFGPVVTVVRVDGDEEALRVANDTEFGLSAAIFSQNVARAWTLARRVESGICHINGPTVHDEPQMPFGGVKSSGYGRFGGKAAIDEFTRLALDHDSNWRTALSVLATRHPQGIRGARRVATALHPFERVRASLALSSLCIGVGVGHRDRDRESLAGVGMSPLICSYTKNRWPSPEKRKRNTLEQTWPTNVGTISSTCRAFWINSPWSSPNGSSWRSASWCSSWTGSTPR